MTGCDYLKNLKVIGFRTVMAMHQTRNCKKNLRKILKKKEFSESEIDNYLKDVEMTIIGFRFPLIFDRNRQLSYLNPDRLKSEGIDSKLLNYYVGEKFEDWQKFIEGKLDIKTLKQREHVPVNFKRVCEFLEFIPDASAGRLNNLCEKLVTFDNFDTIELATRASEGDEGRENSEVFYGSKRIKRESLY